MTSITCPLCGGAGTVRQGGPWAAGDVIEERAVALVTLALGHQLAGDRDAFTYAELVAVTGDVPLRELLPVLAAVASVAAYVTEGSAVSAGADPREYWQQIARHILAPESED